MSSLLKNTLLLFIALIIFLSCKPDDPGDGTAPSLMSSVPADKAVDVSINTGISMLFTEKIVLSANPKISLNNQVVLASVYARTLTVSATLEPATSYTLNIPDKTLSDVAGNFVKSFTITFRTSNAITADGTILEAENASLSNGAVVASATAGYSGTGYVNMNNGNITFNMNAAEAGFYRITARYSSGSPKTQDLHVDGQMAAGIYFPQSS